MLLPDTDAIISERQKTHGNYRENARIAQLLKSVAENEPNWRTLSASQRESVHMIFFKLARIMSGQANYKDHWDDIAGYAHLISKELESK